MTIQLSELGAASNGPKPGPNSRPNMLSVGDSLMWGQGLRPEHRFRELVRLRLAQEVKPVVELSMARSGAKLHPLNNPGVDAMDSTVSSSLYNPPLDPKYSPSDFTREVPYAALTSRQQILDAHKLLSDAAPHADPADIRWILLDGGINDVGIDGILAPIRAYQEGYFLSGWSSWLLKQTRIIQGEMEETLREALSRFPNAVIVVNGYFPIFSYYSVASVTKLQSVGLLYGISNIVLLTPFALDALASASSTWQAASNKHLRRAIRSVRKEFPNRKILFARSNIEGSHALFGPDSWLWGYDRVPDDLPHSTYDWIQWLAGATPEDEVIKERIARCKVLTKRASDAIPCRLASIGHPNLAGANDYARSIIEAMEDAGVISSSLHECSRGRRRRQKACTNFSDEWAYGCVATDAKIGKACADAVRATGNAALNQFSDAGESIKESGKHMKDAAKCFDNVSGNMARAASDQFSKADGHFDAAGDHLNEVEECWDQTAVDMQKCDDDEAADIAECNREYNNRVEGPCDIKCNSYKNCNKYKKWDPRRYTCKAARAACVAAAAVARAACIAGAAVVLATCKTAAWAKSAACKAGVVLDNTVCSAGKVGEAIGEAVQGVAHGFLGVAAAVGEFGKETLCALGNTGKAILDFGKAVGHGFAGILLGVITGLAFIGCSAGRWLVNRGCRLGNWAATKLCRLGATIIDGLCWLAAPFK